MASFELDPKEKAKLAEFEAALKLVTGYRDIDFRYELAPTHLGTAITAVFDFKEILEHDEYEEPVYGRLIHRFTRDITDYDAW